MRWVRPIDDIIPILETDRGNEAMKASGPGLGAGWDSSQSSTDERAR